MGFNIYSNVKVEKDSPTLLKDQWRNWKTINKEMKSIFFPIFKEFADVHLKELSGGACKLYIFLGLKSRNTGESWYSIKSMADSLGVTTRTVDGWLQELEDRGLILRDRFGKTTTSYLRPYSLNMINMKMPIDVDKGADTLSKMIERSRVEKDLVGSLHRIYHIFQWSNVDNIKTIQMLVVITKKSYLKGSPLYTAYVSYGYDTNPVNVLNITEITTPLKFNSWFNQDDMTVIGISLESSNSLTKFVHQKDALLQLSEIPLENLNEFKEIDVIKTSDFITMLSEIDEDALPNSEDELDNNNL